MTARRSLWMSLGELDTINETHFSDMTSAELMMSSNGLRMSMISLSLGL